MFCKKCGKEIDDDSLFCSYCGSKFETNTNSNPEQQISNVQKKQVLLSNKETLFLNPINSLLIIGLIDFIFRVIWYILDEIIRNGNDDIINKYKTILTPFWIINSLSITFLCFLFSKKKDHKIILIIVFLILLVWLIFVNYIR